MKRYKRRQQATVVAIQLDLDTDGLTYRKWGGMQRAKRGDWIVNNQGDVYTVDADSFRSSYQETSPGLYQKVGLVWAEEATSAGTIDTKEGSTDYSPGDFLVFNGQNRRDGYAIKSETFHKLYETAE